MKNADSVAKFSIPGCNIVYEMTRKKKKAEKNAAPYFEYMLYVTSELIEVVKTR